MSKTGICRQFWIIAPRQGEIVKTDLAPMNTGEVMVRAIHSGISRGTESLVFRGDVPPSQYRTMRAPFQEGEFPGPVKYGYASVGEVQDDAGSSGLVGRTVFCLYPHQDVYCVPAHDVAALPEGVPAGRAVLAANMESAVTIVWDAQPSPGDRIVIVGAGVVGLLVAWLCARIPGTNVTIIDVNPARATAARELGVPFSSKPPTHADADVVIHASGHADGLRTSLELAGVEGTVVEASWHGSSDVPLPLGEDFHSKRLTIKSSQVGRIPPARAPRWTHIQRMRLALELLRAPELDVMITGSSEFSDLPEVLAQLSDEPGTALCHRIDYPAP